jgi:hypothetical protein
MFGAPVFFPESIDLIGNAERLSGIGQRQQALDIEGGRQESLAQNRQALSGIKGQQAITNRLGALIQLSGDNPAMATQFLNEDSELQQMLGSKPGQFEFAGRSGKMTVVRDLHGGRTWLLDPTEKDPAKAVRPGPALTPPPRVGEGKTPRSPTKADLAQRAIAGDEEAAQILAETGGLTALKSSLARRAAGAGVTDPYVKALDRKEAKRQFEELQKLDPMQQIVRQALGGGGGDGGDEELLLDEEEEDEEAAAPAGEMTIRHPDGRVRVGPVGAVPEGWERVE